MVQIEKIDHLTSEKNNSKKNWIKNYQYTWSCANVEGGFWRVGVLILLELLWCIVPIPVGARNGWPC